MTLRPHTLLLAATVVLAAALLPAPATAAATKAPSANVAWQPAAADADIARLFAQAKAQHKPLLLYWGATWCPPCNQLKATFFNRQDFAEAARGFVAVHVDGDRPGAQRLGARFQVSGYPTVLLLRADGSEITRLPGEADPDRLMAVLQQGLAGGRPVKAVLADAKAGKALAANEWRMLAFYGWDIDESQLVARSGLANLLADLAIASAKGAEPDVQTRLWLRALAASDEGQGVKADAALRQRVTRLLADEAAARRQADVLVRDAPRVVRALTDDDSAERAALVQAYGQTLRRHASDPTLSRGDRMDALIARIELARMDQPRDAVQVTLPAALVEEVRSHVARDDREITDGYERQAVITSGAYALTRAGLWNESDSLLRSNLARSHSPYYLMSQLGGNARKRGMKDEALRWYAMAWERSEGPATRLQWGSGYLSALVDLSPANAPTIEKVAGQLLQEAAGDPGAFSGRSARSLQRLGRKLVSWNADGQHAEAIRRLQQQLDGVCKRVGTADGARTSCQGLLQAKAGGAGKDAG